MLEPHVSIIGIVVSAAALILNIIEVVYLCRQKKERNNYENIILSLSLADILMAIFFIVSFAYQFHEERSRVVSFVAEQTLWFSITSSLLHVLSISFDRLSAIRFPVKHRHWNTSTKNRIVVILIWFLSLLLMIPSIVTYFATRKSHTLKIINSWVVLAVGVLLAALYAYIIRRTVSTECMIEIITLKSGKREVVSACSPREKRILFVSISIVASFVVCSFPFAIIYIASGKKEGALLLLIANGILNPLIYFFQRRYQEKRSETAKKRAEKAEAEQSSLKMAPPVEDVTKTEQA